jgi:predicted peptidase
MKSKYSFTLITILFTMTSHVNSQSANKRFSVTRKSEVNYLLYLPPAYATEPTTTFPLILFLHGRGESGSDLNLVNRNGIPKLIAEGKEFPFIVVSPQNPASDRSWDTKMLKLLLDDIITTHRVDTSRIYLTGLSMGGWGTWDMAFRNPGLFAAIAPVCGFFDYFMRNELKSTPVWIFHGAKDDVIPVSRSVEMFEALWKQGGEVKITIYPEANHDAWTETFNNPELYDWLLSHRKMEL